MRSKLFSDGLNKDLEKDIPLLERLDPKVIQLYASYFDSISGRSDVQAKKEAIRELAEASSLTADEVSRGFSAAMYILKSVRSEDDDLDAILDDLVAEDIIEDRQSTKDALKAFQGVQAPLKSLMDRDVLIRETFPLVTRVWTRNSVLYGFGESFSSLTDDPDSYEPTVEQVVPVVLLNLTVEEKDETSVLSAAITHDKLELLRDHLELAKKELDLIIEMSAQKESSSNAVTKQHESSSKAEAEE